MSSADMSQVATRISEFPDAVRSRLGEFPGEMDADAGLCRLEELQGRKVRCPEEKCAFWEPGGAVLQGRCVLHGIDFSREPGLADWLREFRDGLATKNAIAD